MEDLIIEPSQKTPRVNLSEGAILFQGRSIINDTNTFFEPIHSWINQYIITPTEKTNVTIKLEYIDASSVQSVLQILRKLKEVEERNLGITVNWYYMYGDLEMLQLGVILQERLEMEFEFSEFESNNIDFY